MADTPEKNSGIDEEPQEERGPKGSRDTGSSRPSAGPADRPSGTSDERSDTSVQPKRPQDPKSPGLRSGGG
ncbi:hypothetical protein [Streptomyces sp. NBC_00893]|uniref:hypothetical protein n=1 Tax=Streptomyces sp. NBC_00893 TaxID=2975862 RepID=UPI00224D7193|nr:hypothetical protein [Streptomyces sp. NBC_00893]MCX4849642.1 hypothetical protein [Streptomyces sp. NBC_00893]